MLDHTGTLELAMLPGNWTCPYQEASFEADSQVYEKQSVIPTPDSKYMTGSLISSSPQQDVQSDYQVENAGSLEQENTGAGCVSNENSHAAILEAIQSTSNKLAAELRSDKCLFIGRCWRLLRS